MRKLEQYLQKNHSYKDMIIEGTNGHLVNVRHAQYKSDAYWNLSLKGIHGITKERYYEIFFNRCYVINAL